MERNSSPTASFNFLGTLAKTLRLTCTWQCWILARENSSRNTFSRPGKPPIMPNFTREGFRPRLLRSFMNCLQLKADSLSPACSLSTVRRPSSLTPMATRTGILSMLPSTLIGDVTPSRIMYLIGPSPRSRSLHRSTASVSSFAALPNPAMG